MTIPAVSTRTLTSTVRRTLVVENDDFFEKEELLLKIKASSSKELLSQLDRLRDCLDQSEMEAIFRMLQG